MDVPPPIRIATARKGAVAMDLQCFKDNANRFLPKEVTVIDVRTGTLLLHHIAKPLFDRDSLSEEKLRESYWLTKHCHGIDWERGDIPYYALLDKVRACLARRALVYVKGGEKRDYVRRELIADPIGTTVVDAADIGCDTLAATCGLLSAHTVRCGRHRTVQSRCALANCIALRTWLLLTGNETEIDYESTEHTLL